MIFKNVTGGEWRIGEARLRDYLVHRLQIQIPNGAREVVYVR